MLRFLKTTDFQSAETRRKVKFWTVAAGMSVDFLFLREVKMGK